MEPTFRVGDLAVYPAHGVAQIIGIETREISSTKQTFYILKILDNGMKIMIPTKNAGAVGLRELIREDEVDEVFEILKSRAHNLFRRLPNTPSALSWGRERGVFMHDHFLDRTPLRALFDIPTALIDQARAMAYQSYRAGRLQQAELLCRGLLAVDHRCG